MSSFSDMKGCRRCPLDIGSGPFWGIIEPRCAQTHSQPIHEIRKVERATLFDVRLGRPLDRGGNLIRDRLSPQYWPFPASLRRQAVDGKDRAFVVGRFGSADRPNARAP
jgi:hypothetical protein